jgi:uncharacterized membrane protein YfcA
MTAGILSVFSGALVGLLLGLLGGGGSILGVPLLIYVVGVDDPHIAIGTSAVAVAASAAINLVLHARSGNIKWPCAVTYAVSGSIGAAMGAALGKSVDGRRLLLAFSAAMVGVGVSMLLRKTGGGDVNVRISPSLALRIVPVGFLTGMASGFFGIGGGFLIVPGLIEATNMTALHAVGSSLVSVTAFGAATAASYALSGLVLWNIAALFILGGLVGGVLGQRIGLYLSGREGMLSRVFACFIFAAAGYVAWRSHG